jgi:aldose 1-epimerase
MYPMVPWAGRVRRGRFAHGGQDVQLPLRLPPHAIHGTVFESAWQVVDQSVASATLRTHLGGDWPWPGEATHALQLDATQARGVGLRCRLEVRSLGPAFPAQVGWHPWFADGGRPPHLTFAAQAMYRRDADGIAIAEMVRPAAHPWDDCFVGVTEPPRLRYADGLTLVLRSDCDHWVVYEPDHAVCVEPQSGPPDGFTLAPVLVSAAQPLSRSLTIAAV